MKVKEFAIRYCLPGISVLIACLAGFVYFSSDKSWSAALSAQRMSISELQSQVSSANIESEELVEEILDSVSAISSQRLEQDRERVRDLMSDVMTWDSYASYMQVREDIMSEYNLAEDSSFMKMFLPDIPSITDENSGVVYNPIDNVLDGAAGLNMKFEDVTVYLRGVSGDVYTYMAFVTWSAVGNGGHESMHTDTIMLSLDRDGKFSNIQGYFGVT